MTEEILLKIKELLEQTKEEKDSIELNYASEVDGKRLTGHIKVYGDASKPEEFGNKIENILRLASNAEAKKGSIL